MEAPHASLAKMINGYWLTQALHTAARLGIADLLAASPRTASELAEKTDANPRSLSRLLRALASAGVFNEVDGAYRLTPMGELLRSDVPGSLRGVAVYSGDPEHYAAWGQLHHSVKTGERAFDHVFGERIFDYMAARPDVAATFNTAMAGYSAESARVVAEHFDPSPFAAIVDVAGGDGRLLAALLDRAPNARGVIVEMPHVVEPARAFLVSRGLATRTEVIAGNIFESIPASGDLYVMKWILHDWDDEAALRILRNIRTVIPQGGRLLIAEAVIPPGNDPFFGKLMDLNMLVMTGGCERTAAEFQQLLRAAGFELDRVTTTGSIVDLVEAVPV